MIEPLASMIRNYAWGDLSALATIQGRPTACEPEAELWMGAHPSASSVVVATGQPLNEAIAANPLEMLGETVAETFGQLPFLAKILAAAEPLSIQVHPSLDQAIAGFAREEAAGIERDAPDRTYRDANHKPELICAITRFEAKCGFRRLATSRRLFSHLTDPRAAGLAERLNQAGQSDEQVLSETLSWLLKLSPRALTDLVDGIVESSPATSEFAKDLAWIEPMHMQYGADVGIPIGLLLNHVVLEPGQALFLGPGNVHAYLRGVGVELMANSDNVIRCGLTPKHVDVDELLAVVSCTPLDPPIQSPAGAMHRFESPVPEFALTRIIEASSLRLESVGPEIIVVTDGSFTVRRDDGSAAVTMRSGDVVFLSPDDAAYLVDGAGALWRSTVGNI
ncbi:MAG: mannose-6-phosphate isomerase, class I [Acidimicrobiales bacterium]